MSERVFSPTMFSATVNKHVVGEYGPVSFWFGMKIRGALQPKQLPLAEPGSAPIVRKVEDGQSTFLVNLEFPDGTPCTLEVEIAMTTTKPV
jgi:hypothetical protein